MDPLRQTLKFLTFAMVILPAVASGQEVRDTVYLHQRNPVVGNIQGSDGNTITVAIPVGNGQGTAQTQIPFQAIERIEVGLSDLEKQALQADGSSTNDNRQTILSGAWQRVGSVIQAAPNNAGPLIVELLEVMLAQEADDPTVSEQVLTLANEALERGTHLSAEHRVAITQSKVVALTRLDRMEEAVALLNESSDLGAEGGSLVETAVIRQHMAAAELAERSLYQLEEEWPKWHLMPEKIEERRRLIYDALSGYLYGATLKATERNLAATGLRKAAELLNHIDQPEQAVLRLDDILEFFADTPEASLAQALKENILAEHPDLEIPGAS